MMGYDGDIFEGEFKKDVINGKGWKFYSKWKLIEEGINRKIFLLWALEHKITFSSWLFLKNYHYFKIQLPLSVELKS